MIWPFHNRQTDDILERAAEPLWKIEPPRPWPEPPALNCGLTNLEINTLAIYNGEVYRGIVHTEEWKKQMSELQQRWDKRERIVPR